MIAFSCIGNLGDNAEIVKVSNNTQTVVKFSVAVNESYLNKEGVRKTSTTWVRCSLWNREGFAKHLVKGAKVFVQGKPYSDGYVKNGEAMTNLCCTVSRVDLLFPPKKDSEEDSSVSISSQEEAGSVSQ